MAHYNGTLQWHHVHSAKISRHPPKNPPPQPSHTTMAPCNGTQQWHHVHSTWAHYNGTLRRHPAMAPRPLNLGTLQWHPTKAPSNGTTSTAPCNGILVPRPMRKSGSSPSLLLEVRTPIAIAIWGKIRDFTCKSWNPAPGLSTLDEYFSSPGLLHLAKAKNTWRSWKSKHVNTWCLQLIFYRVLLQPFANEVCEGCPFVAIALSHLTVCVWICSWPVKIPLLLGVATTEPRGSVLGSGVWMTKFPCVLEVKYLVVIPKGIQVASVIPCFNIMAGHLPFFEPDEMPSIKSPQICWLMSLAVQHPTVTHLSKLSQQKRVLFVKTPVAACFPPVEQALAME